MTKTHVALVTPWQQQGGIATYAERFASELEDTGVKVTPIPIKYTKTSNPLSFVDILDDVPADADVIHVQFEAGLFGHLGMSGIGAPAFFIALSRNELPVVVTLHEVHAEHGHRSPVGDYLLRGRDGIIERLALRAADATIVHTAEARRVLKKRHGNRWRIERMLHPTDADADPIPTAKAKAKLGVEGPVALTFGFVEEKKRYEDVIRVLPEFPDLTYLIAGGFREHEGEAVWKRCQELASELGVADRVRHLGYIDEDEMSAVFSAADVVVLPYERVSQSGVINDALAYRRPVIASSLPAFEELRREYGCLLTYNNHSGLLSQLKELLLDCKQRKVLIQRSEIYKQNISWEDFSKQTTYLYDSVKNYL